MKTQLSVTFENSKNYTLAVAEAMPEKFYNFKPTDEAWTFNELINHIAYGILWWDDNFIKKTQPAWNPPAAKENKKETVKYLLQCYEALKESIEIQKLTDENVKGFFATFDHITHHRGQAVLHLRINGVAPPEYVF